MARTATTKKKPKISQRCEHCKKYNDATDGYREVCTHCGQIMKLPEAGGIFDTLAVDPSPAEDTLPDYGLDNHPWKKVLTLPEGMINARSNCVTVRSLCTVKSNKIILPDTSRRSCGWFVVGIPGNSSDINQRMAQEMVLEIKKGNETFEVMVGPGDILAAMDVQCWPIEIQDKEAQMDKWRMLDADQTLQVIRVGSPLYEHFLTTCYPFKNEKETDVSI